MRELFLLEPDVIFLNHGSFGATPRPVFEVYQEWQRRLESQPVRFLGRELGEHLAQARAELGRYLNAHPDDLIFIPNATYGANVVARSLRLEHGDEILASDQEYGACEYAWEYVCERTGAIYRRQAIPLQASEEERVEAFWQGVAPRTKVIFLSHITSPTALRLPVEPILQRAREAGLITVIDAAHSPGQIPLNLAGLDVDFLFGNAHKWMMAPKGSAFLYVRRERQAQLEPLVVSWGYHPSPEMSSGSRFLNLFQWTGTRDPAAWLSVPAAIRFMEEHQWEGVRQRSHLLLRQVLEAFADLTGLPPAYAQDSDYAQMGIVPLPPLPAKVLKERLYEEYHIEIPVIEWAGKLFLRISVQGYNTPDELETLLRVMRRLLNELS
uniref:Aminotransferase class V n=1 Tax=uncultured Chloroflexota bacterium TaxID=166587 RepID=H5SAJ9_9CHLR|nr:aminotransferase class V [uncultured Chloroflexota bacterium]